jgi:hypothetical protein
VNDDRDLRCLTIVLFTLFGLAVVKVLGMLS